jgi:flagellar protein FlaG
MTNEITTQQVNDGVVKGRNLELGGVEKVKAPARRDNSIKQILNGNGNTAELDTAQKQKADNTEKVREIAKETVDYFNKFVKEVQVDLRYEVDDKTNEIVVKVFEKGSDKLIRQIPPDAILHLKQRMNDLLGIIFDETA